MEIWEISEPLQWPQQRTFTGRNVTFGAWSPAGDKIAFGVDQAGNERTQLYLLDDNDGNVTQLTDEPSVIHRWGSWSRDGSRFAYSANRQQQGVFDVYIQDRNETHNGSRLVYEQTRPSSVVPISWGPDNERLLVLEAHSDTNNDVHLVDVETGSNTMLTNGPEHPTRYRSVMWGPDRKSLYMITNKDYNWLYIARFDLKTSNIEPVVQAQANIKTMVLHASKERIAYIKYKNGYSKITSGRLTDATTINEFPAPDFPEGVAESLAVNSDGTRQATVFYTPDTKPDLYTIDIDTGDIIQWTDTSSPVPNEVYVTPEPVMYESFDGLDIPSFYMEPDQTTGNTVPAMIHLHGGPREQVFPAFDPQRQYYIEQGFARLEPNYRGSSGYGREYMSLDDIEKRPDAVEDIKSGAEWLADQDAVDEDRIVLYGTSYGAFMVLSAMVRWPNLFAAGVAIAPITNFETYLKNTGPWRRRHREAEYGSLEEHRELLKQLSPIHNIDNLQSPLFIAHGKNDSRVPIEETKQVAAYARDHDIPVETLFINDGGHRLSAHEHRIKVCSDAANFLNKHV